MAAGYDPKTYWDARLTRHGGLRGTGHISFSETYNEWLYKAKSRTLSRALHSTPLRDKEVLDVGCGNGYFVDWYLTRGARVTGIDISPSGIELLRKRFRCDFRVMDITTPGTSAIGQFDIVNIWDVLYHVVDDEAFARALQFLAASVRTSGLLLVTDRMGATGDTRVAEHVRMRCLATYQQHLQGSGLELVEQQFLYRWLNRYVSIPLLDSRLGGLYYRLDGRETRVPADNLSLAVWRRTTSS